ncbi:hypothetical protein EVA_04105 [gut metagenome]|uniref:Uncharacterized protein n=1 Tax=gut metagenome TaxID=749906 RepID=J9GXF8_9ZZZZ
MNSENAQQSNQCTYYHPFHNLSPFIFTHISIQFHIKISRIVVQQ